MRVPKYKKWNLRRSKSGKSWVTYLKKRRYARSWKTWQDAVQHLAKIGVL